MVDMVFSREIVGDADRPVTVATDTVTGRRYAVFPIDGTTDIHFEGRKLWVGDVLWFGRWTIEREDGIHVLYIELKK